MAVLQEFKCPCCDGAIEFDSALQKMKCPYCGYDKIQPNFNFCPTCKRPLNEQVQNIKKTQTNQSNLDAQQKNLVTRILSGWTFEKAMNKIHAYVNWAANNPHDHNKFMEKWEKNGLKWKTII